MSRADILVTVSELVEALAGAEPPTLLDVRWALTDPPGAGRARYAAGHLPGAAFLDLETALTRHTGDPRDGRHPLPDLDVLREALIAAGVRMIRQIVVYDEPGSFAAGRAWWVLRWVGLPVRVLDGGITAWTAAGHPLTTATTAPFADATPAREVANGAFPGLQSGQLPTLTTDEAAVAPRRGVLIDVRAPERFRGDIEPIDPVAGHIPGAVNIPVASLFAADGTLPDEATLRERLAPALAAADCGAEVATYCGSGVSAAQGVLALATFGVPAALYPGSWSSWCHDPMRPVSTGP
ncbi:MAG: sulfurtransferase [Actinomycetales bacterium]|nr:sulfurtransferase [Candidatus Phosphoribacter baldrii]